MSHLVEKMAYVGQEPWHGLGNKLPAGQSIETWASSAGMNWSIEQTPVRFVTGQADGMVNIGSFADQQVLYRSDNHEPLSVVSKRYKVVQPREILEFYRDLTEYAGFELETAGVLKGGRKLWALARTGQQALLKGDDEVRGYLLLATACDGTLATTAQFTSVRVVCNNTLSIAVNRDADPGAGVIKVPHSTEFDADAVKAQLGLTITSWDRFISQMNRLASRKVSEVEAEGFFLKVLNCSPKDVDFIDSEAGEESAEWLSTPGKLLAGGSLANSTNISTFMSSSVSELANAQSPALRNERAYKRVQELYTGAAMGANMTSAKSTAWGLVNAVTEFVDHHRKARNQDNRLDSAWFGVGANLKKKALDEALLMIS